MKRLLHVSMLACAVLLLSACPDTKLPTPTPKVPEPKAQSLRPDVLPHTASLYQPQAGMTAAIGS